MRYAQLVMGPAGCGKSTYCSHLVRHAQDLRRVISVVNLDPAAEYFDYEVTADIRDLIHLSDVMEDEDLRFGPNGGLIFCLEYLLQNIDWLEDQLGDDDDDYILFDCPGQIELYTHLNLMKQLVATLQNRNFHLCGVFLLDSQFMVEPSKFFAGSLAALSAMVNLEIPHINILSKIDLLNRAAKKKLDRYLEPDIHLLLEDEVGFGSWSKKFQKLSEALGKVIDDYSLVRFLPLNIKEPESITDLLLTIDNAIQYGEDADVKTKLLDNETDPMELHQKDENKEEYMFPH